MLQEEDPPSLAHSGVFWRGYVRVNDTFGPGVLSFDLKVCSFFPFVLYSECPLSEIPLQLQLSMHM